MSRLFDDHTGMSIPDYINRLRVALAQQLLAETRLDMERVAGAGSGFASSRQLRRAWGRLNPTSPSAATHGCDWRTLQSPAGTVGPNRRFPI